MNVALCRPPALRRGLASAALALLAMSSAAGHAGPLCLDTALQATPLPRAQALATAARQEHEAFGGQTLDAEGRLVESGYSEAEALRGPSRRPAPWERVIGYWRAVDAQEGRLPTQVAFGAWRPADRKLLRQA